MSKQVKILLVGLVLSILVVSCKVYVPPKEHQFEKSQTYIKDYNKVWEEIITFLGENNINVTSMEKVSGFIKANYADARIKGSIGMIMDCGENADIKSILGEFNIVVTKVNDTQVKVTINTFYSCVRVVNPYTNPPQIEKSNCNSTGAFENHILNYIRMN